MEQKTVKKTVNLMILTLLDFLFSRLSGEKTDPSETKPPEAEQSAAGSMGTKRSEAKPSEPDPAQIETILQRLGFPKKIREQFIQDPPMHSFFWIYGLYHHLNLDDDIEVQSLYKKILEKVVKLLREYEKNGVIVLSEVRKMKSPLAWFVEKNREKVEEWLIEADVELLDDTKGMRGHEKVRLYLKYHFGTAVDLSEVRRSHRTVYRNILLLGNPNEVVTRMGFEVKGKRPLDKK